MKNFYIKIFHCNLQVLYVVYCFNPVVLIVLFFFLSLATKEKEIFKLKIRKTKDNIIIIIMLSF